MKRKSYKPKTDGLLNTSTAMAHMRNVAFNPQTARRTINRLDNLHDDDTALAKADAKRARKAAKRAAQVTQPNQLGGSDGSKE